MCQRKSSKNQSCGHCEQLFTDHQNDDNRLHFLIGGENDYETPIFYSNLNHVHTPRGLLKVGSVLHIRIESILKGFDSQQIIDVELDSTP